MGYGNLTVDARSTLQEIARMAYGSGLFEGTSGGKGRMGVLCDANGKARIIKFNTHVGERLFGDSLSVHEVVYRRDGSSEAVKLCLEQSDDPNRQKDKEIGDLTEFVNDVKQGG